MINKIRWTSEINKTVSDQINADRSAKQPTDWQNLHLKINKLFYLNASWREFNEHCKTLFGLRRHAYSTDNKENEGADKQQSARKSKGVRDTLDVVSNIEGVKRKTKDKLLVPSLVVENKPSTYAFTLVDKKKIVLTTDSKNQNIFPITPLPSNQIDEHIQTGFSKVLNRFNTSDADDSSVDEEDNSLYEEALSRTESERLLPESVKIQYVSKEVGFGVFAAKKITKGSVVGEYTGKIKTIVRIEKEDPKQEYSFIFDKKSIYDAYGLDARNQGNFARFMNHKPDRDANVESGIYYNQTGPHILLIAKENIKKNEQLFFDYGSKFWKKKQVTPERL